jgi:transposase InsO family protein
MMLFRDCVRRYGRLPQIVVADNGPEFGGTYFDSFLAFHGCTKKNRPPAECRVGAVIERYFGSTNTRFFNNLQGNTQASKNVREMTAATNPQKHAIWNLSSAYYYLDKWLFETYDTIEHPALGQSPRDAFASGMDKFGRRLHRLIPYDDTFRFMTFPTTRREVAKVNSNLGIRIENIYYWTDMFRRPDVAGSKVEVRYDPLDRSVAAAYIKNRWIECHSEQRHIFHGKTSFEIEIASQELSQHLSLNNKRVCSTAKQIARFLESVESHELLLKQQIMSLS